MKSRRIPGKGIFALAFWLGVWALVAAVVDRELLFPGPVTVVRRLVALAGEGMFWRVTAVSLLRIICGAAAGIFAGAVLALGTDRSRLLDALFAPLMGVIQAVPVASFILLVLIWVGRDILPTVIVFLMVLPVVWSNMSEGLRSADRDLLELARVYGFSRWKTAQLVYGPSIAPYFLSACRACLGLAWKSGVAAEVLTVPAQAIGRELYEAKLYMNTADLFAWTAVVAVCSLVIEYILDAAIVRLGRRRRMGGDGP